MTHNLRISIAMCTYNGSRFLTEQLASIVAQTRLPDELVICDDGSTDATSEIVDKFACAAPFVVRFTRNPENLGSTKNFEKAIGLCTGDLIALCDQDDIWLPEKLARQAEMMERDPELGGVFCDAEIVDAHSELLGKQLWASLFFTRREQKQFRDGHAIEVLLKRNVVTGATLMVRASVRPVFMPIPSVSVHDAWIAWRLLVHSSLTFFSEPLIRYRLHAGQQLGVEELAQAQLPLLQRLKKGKRTDPARHLAMAAQLEELRRRLLASEDPAIRDISFRLQEKIAFLRDRAAHDTNRAAKTLQLLRHAGDYQRYEVGWKPFVRDIVIVFV